MVNRLLPAVIVAVSACAVTSSAQRNPATANPLRVALAKQPFSPTGISKGPATMAEGGIQQTLAELGAEVRVQEARLTAEEDREYGGWKRLGMALGHFADLVHQNEREGYFTIGLLATCPSMPGLVAGLQRSPDGAPRRVGMLWLDAHPDFNTPETTRSGSLGGMPVAVATGRALQGMRLDATLDPPLPDHQVVMGGIRLTDPLEQQMLDRSAIEQVGVDDLRTASPALFAQLDRLSRSTDRIYVHIDMDVLDPREVMGHGNKVPGGPSSEELARLFEQIFRRYDKAAAIGFATIPPTDEGGLSIAALNRMIAGAVRGVQARAGNSPATTAPAEVQKETPAMIRANGTFDVSLAPQPLSDTGADKTLARMAIDKRFHGDLEGTSKGEMLSALTATSGSAGYVAIERVTGTIGGRKGSFVLQHNGTMTRGAQQLTIAVVPDSGTGELAGITGTMSIRIDDGKHYYEFLYSLR